jgi:uncharacterized protein YdaU (DUF1376 family)
MNFYSFHIGDYMTKTRHLSWEEDIAYRRLIDVYYGAEKPLPADKRAVYRLIVAVSSKQKQAVDAVLAEFFELQPDGYHNERCDAELAAHASKRDKAKQSADMRWEKERAAKSHSEGSAEAMRTHSEGNAPITHYPLPNTQKEGGVGYAREISSADLEAKLREAAGWQSEPAPNLAVTGPIEALIESGADLERDVLPVVTAIAPQATSRTSWKYFVKAIARARDERIAAAKIVTHPSAMRPANGQDRKRGNSLLEAAAQLDDEYAQRIRAAEAREGIEPDAHESARDIG